MKTTITPIFTITLTASLLLLAGTSQAQSPVFPPDQVFQPQQPVPTYPQVPAYPYANPYGQMPQQAMPPAIPLQNTRNTQKQLQKPLREFSGYLGYRIRSSA